MDEATRAEEMARHFAGVEAFRMMATMPQDQAAARMRGIIHGFLVGLGAAAGKASAQAFLRTLIEPEPGAPRLIALDGCLLERRA